MLLLLASAPALARWCCSSEPRATGCRYPLGVATHDASWIECLSRTEVSLSGLRSRLLEADLDRSCLQSLEHYRVRAGQQLHIGRDCHFSVGRLSFRRRFVLGRKVDINRGTPADLQLLPGIGPVLARRIVAKRERLGGFASWQQLRAVRGVGPATISRLRPVSRIGQISPRSWTPKDP
jgi:competence ComEA-like helix-hairpin-helix protein